MSSDGLPHNRNGASLNNRPPGEPGIPHRTMPLNRLRNTTPKDTIPITGKPPRKQRSSRFHPSEKVEIERLPSFAGPFILLPCLLIRTSGR